MSFYGPPGDVNTGGGAAVRLVIGRETVVPGSVPLAQTPDLFNGVWVSARPSLRS